MPLSLNAIFHAIALKILRNFEYQFADKFSLKHVIRSSTFIFVLLT